MAKKGVRKIQLHLGFISQEFISRGAGQEDAEYLI